MKFSLWNHPNPLRQYWVNRVHHPPTVGFTERSEAEAEARRLSFSKPVGWYLTVTTIEMFGQEEVQVVSQWHNGTQTIFTPKETMAKYTLTTIPHDLDKFWIVLLEGTQPREEAVPVHEVKDEAMAEAAKIFNKHQGQKKVLLLESVAVIDAVVPKVEWRTDLKVKQPVAA